MLLGVGPDYPIGLLGALPDMLLLGMAAMIDTEQRWRTGPERVVRNVVSWRPIHGSGRR